MLRGRGCGWKYPFWNLESGLRPQTSGLSSASRFNGMIHVVRLRPEARGHRPTWVRLWVALLMSAFLGCSDAESIFAEGRLENRCNGAIPVCGGQASCVLAQDQFYRGRFPGGTRFVVRTVTGKTRFQARFLFSNPS